MPPPGEGRRINEDFCSALLMTLQKGTRMMKYRILCLLLGIAGAVFFSSCASTDTEEEKDIAPEFEISSFSMAPARDKRNGTFLDDRNFLMSWNILGPVKAADPASFHAESVPDEKNLNGSRRAPRGARWHVIRFGNDGEDDIPGTVDFTGRITGKTGGKSIFYACATLETDSELRNLVLNAGSCGKVKIWINGALVYSYEKNRRDFKPDSASIGGITLRKGLNRIVVKYMDNGGDYAKERKFCLRFTDEQGQPTLIR